MLDHDHGDATPAQLDEQVGSRRMSLPPVPAAGSSISSALAPVP